MEEEEEELVVLKLEDQGWVARPARAEHSTGSPGFHGRRRSELCIRVFSIFEPL